MCSLSSVFTLFYVISSRLNKQVETVLVHNTITFQFGYITLKHITESLMTYSGKSFEEVLP